jgi:hypothetical protein
MEMKAISAFQANYASEMAEMAVEYGEKRKERGVKMKR